MGAEKMKDIVKFKTEGKGNLSMPCVGTELGRV